VGLESCIVGAVIPVSDVERAREFYEGKLGLTPGAESDDGGVDYACAEGTRIHVYPSPGAAGGSGATLAGWRTTEVEALVDELSARGVVFESYDTGTIKTNEKGIAEFGDTMSAWFKDPDGNILGVVNL
jgi:catechol 2,3-dioxygenase-like lactoylglutathione lyase family enzyme